MCNVYIPAFLFVGGGLCCQARVGTRKGHLGLEINFVLVRGSCMASSSLVLQRSGLVVLVWFERDVLELFLSRNCHRREAFFARVPAVPPCIRPHSSREPAQKLLNPNAAIPVPLGTTKASCMYVHGAGTNRRRILLLSRCCCYCCCSCSCRRG